MKYAVGGLLFLSSTLAIASSCGFEGAKNAIDALVAERKKVGSSADSPVESMVRSKSALRPAQELLGDFLLPGEKANFIPEYLRASPALDLAMANDPNFADWVRRQRSSDGGAFRATAMQVRKFNPKTDVEFARAAYRAEQEMFLESGKIEKWFVDSSKRPDYAGQLYMATEDLIEDYLARLESVGLKGKRVSEEDGTDRIEFDLERSDPNHWLVVLQRENPHAPQLFIDPTLQSHLTDADHAYFSPRKNRIALPIEEATAIGPSTTILHEVYHYAVSEGTGSRELPEFIGFEFGGKKWKSDPLMALYSGWTTFDEIGAYASELIARYDRAARIIAAHRSYEAKERAGTLSASDKIRRGLLPSARAIAEYFSDFSDDQSAPFTDKVEMVHKFAVHALTQIDKAIDGLRTKKLAVEVDEDALYLPLKDAQKQVLEFDLKSKRVSVNESEAKRLGLGASEFKALQRNLNAVELNVLFRLLHNRAFAKSMIEKIDQIEVTPLEQAGALYQARGQFIQPLSGYRRAIQNLLVDQVAGAEGQTVDSAAFEPQVVSSRIFSDDLARPYHEKNEVLRVAISKAALALKSKNGRADKLLFLARKENQLLGFSRNLESLKAGDKPAARDKVRLERLEREKVRRRNRFLFELKESGLEAEYVQLIAEAKADVAAKARK